MESHAGDNSPTPQDVAAAIAAVRLFLRRRDGAKDGGDRWTRIARAEAVAPAMTPAPAVWATLERPR